MTTSNPQNTPDTVSELLSLNQPEQTDLDRVQEVMSTVGYDDTLTVVRWLTSNLLDFHTERVEELECESNQKTWVRDQQTLNIVLNLLKTVQ